MLLFKNIFLPARLPAETDGPSRFMLLFFSSKGHNLPEGRLCWHCRCKLVNLNIIYHKWYSADHQRPALHSDACSPSWPRWHSRGWSCWASCCPSPSYLPIFIRIKHYAVPISYPVLVLAPEHVAILEVLHPLPVLEPILELPFELLPVGEIFRRLPIGLALLVIPNVDVAVVVVVDSLPTLLPLFPHSHILVPVGKYF